MKMKIQFLRNNTSTRKWTNKGNQSFYIDALYERSMNVKDIKINSYSYYIGDKYYETDLISKTVNVY